MNQSQAFPLSRDLSKTDIEMLTMEVIDEEIFETMKQINLLGPTGLNSMQAIFYHKSQDIINKAL